MLGIHHRAAKFEKDRTRGCLGDEDSAMEEGARGPVGAVSAGVGDAAGQVQGCEGGGSWGGRSSGSPTRTVEGDWRGQAACGKADGMLREEGAWSMGEDEGYIRACLGALEEVERDFRTGARAQVR